MEKKARRTKQKATPASRLLAVGTSPEEKALAEEIAELLPEPLTPADAIAFNLLLARATEWLALNHIVRDVGISQASDRSGVRHLSPEARREAEVFTEILKLCREFGLTPLSRSKLAAMTGAAAARPAPFAGFISADPGAPME